MNIAGTASQIITGHAGDRKGRDKAMDDRIGLPPEQILAAAQEKSAETTAAGPQPPATGMIRNLQDGHFQGVAGVRLQINFHQRLELAATSQANQAVAAGSQTLVSGVRQQVFSIHQEFTGIFAGVDTAADIDRLFSSFSEAVDTLFTDLNAPATTPGGLLNGIHQAFSGFFESFADMGALFTTPPATGDTEAPARLATDQPTGENALIQPATDRQAATTVADTESLASTTDDTMTTPTFADRLNELHSWFDETFAAMTAQVEQLLQPLPLGEPRGNGQAYSRVVAVYQEMYQVTAPGMPSVGDNDSAVTTTA